MRVLHVASEIYPFVKTGGLGDVLAALPPALRDRGVDVRLLLPGYPPLLSAIEDQEPAGAVMVEAVGQVPLRGGRLPGSGLPVYLVEAPGLFARPGNPYLGPDGRDWPDNHRRFALLGRMAAAFTEEGSALGWMPDIVHAHDWHAGLAPAYVRALGSARAASVFTIHNLAFQGLFPAEVFASLDLPESYFAMEGLEFFGQVSFMKAALHFADRITTVSPSYAREIQTPQFGFGLDGILRARRSALQGILNGVDYGIWNPEADPLMPRPFGPLDLAGKAEAKAVLQRRMGLMEDPARPLFGAVTRLTEQKGFDLVLEVLPELLRDGAQVVVLGSGDAVLEAAFRSSADSYPQQLGVLIGYDEALAHSIIGGSDVMLVPSRFEPCGLTQLYAMRYGTLPLVHQVGGLADTVIDADRAEGGSAATGIVFDEPSASALAEAFRRACTLFRDRERWRRLQRQAMARDFSWAAAAASYEALYEATLAERGPG